MRKTHDGHATCTEAGTSYLKKLTPGQLDLGHIDSIES